MSAFRIIAIACTCATIFLQACERTPSSLPATSSTGAASATSYLAWGRDAEENVSTHWLDCTEAACSSVAQRRGAVVVEGERLWEVVVSEAAYLSYTCDDQIEAPKHRPKRSDALRVQGARVRSLGTQPIEHVVVAGDDPANDDAFAERFSQSVRLLGSLGPQLFIQVDTAGYFCGGAHETSGSSFVLWDLQTQTARTPIDASWSREERAAVGMTERATARKALEDKLRTHTEGVELASEDVTLAALFPTYGTSGLAFDLMFVASACRTCGDGIWTDYSVAVRVPLRTPVKSLGAIPGDPAALTNELAQSGLKLAGVSEVPKPMRASLLRRFND